MLPAKAFLLFPLRGEKFKIDQKVPVPGVISRGGGACQTIKNHGRKRGIRELRYYR